MFFCDATMYIYDNSTALEPHSVECDTIGLYGLAATGHHTMSTSRPRKTVTLLSCHPIGDSQLLKLGIAFFHSHEAARNKCLVHK